ncbi:MAG: hypothetical protein U0931_29145 [Vulcanimicrobiota bacterium]
MIIRKLIDGFARMTELCWEEFFLPIEDGAERRELLDDWLQFHWEFLVEGPLQKEVRGLVLDRYGGGAETPTGRILEPEVEANHSIFCHPKNGLALEEQIGLYNVSFPPSGLRLEQLAHCYVGKPFDYYKPPLNCVMVMASNEFLAPYGITYPLLFRLDDVEFELRPMERTIPL